MSMRLQFAIKNEESLCMQHEQACVLGVLHIILLSVLVQYLILYQIDEWSTTSVQPAFSWVASPEH